MIFSTERRQRSDSRVPATPDMLFSASIALAMASAASYLSEQARCTNGNAFDERVEKAPSQRSYSSARFLV
jgi:hypothetical protein